MRNILRIAALSALIAAPLSAQGVTGSWITEFERQVRNENGAVSSGDKARARMTLQQKGDSVTGTWALVNPPANAPAAAPRQLRGTITGNKATLISEFDARVNFNGEESTKKITVVYEFTVSDDKLEGTMTMRTENEMPPRPFSAVREKA